MDKLLIDLEISFSSTKKDGCCGKLPHVMPNDQALPNKVGQRKVSGKIGAKNYVGYLQ